jgi:hypothetical protein
MATQFRQTQNTPPKLLDQARDRIRVKHYNIRTEALYVQWVKRFNLFHGKRHPQAMETTELEAFLTHLAVDGHALLRLRTSISAPLFPYKGILAIALPWLNRVARAKQPQRLPIVLIRMKGVYGLMANMLCGVGMRLKAAGVY